MSLLKDMFDVDNIIEEFKNIRSPEDLQRTIQLGKDVFDKHITELKNIPSELERWQSVAKDIGILSEGADYVNQAQDILLKNAIEMSKGTMLEGKLGLENILKTRNSLINKDIPKLSIGGVKIDYMHKPNPTYYTTAYSQPIISSSNIDRLSEHAENENPRLSITCLLKGEDRQARFNQLNQIRENKQIIKVVSNLVYDRMIITKIKPNYDNSNGLELKIDFENIFVAQLKRTASKRIETKNNNLAKPVKAIPAYDSSILVNGPTAGVAYKLENPIPPELEPQPTLNDFLKPPQNIGFMSPLMKKVYGVDKK